MEVLDRRKPVDKILYLYGIILCSGFCIASSENLGTANNEDVQESTVVEDETTILPEPTESFFETQQQEANIKIPYTNSPLYLTQLALNEQSIYQSLLVYEMQLKHRLEILQRLRSDYESSVLVAMQQLTTSTEHPEDWLKATVVSSHPILAYRMIRRFATDLQEFTDHIWQSLEHELWETLESRRSKFAWPSQEDLLLATKSLIRIQDTHDFDITQFADGAIRDQKIQVGLTARQCLQISQTALQLGEINAAADWFQAAHFKGVNDLDNSVSMDELTQAWESTYQAFQSIWPMNIFTTHDVFKEAKLLLRNTFNILKTNLTAEHIPINFKALCRGDKILPRSQALKLTCHLESWSHPYYYINPLRIELYNRDPLVYQVHDFIGPTALIDLTHIVVPSMVSLMESGNAAFQGTNENKTYTFNFLLDNTASLLTTLTNKIDRLSHIARFQEKTVPSDNYQISAFAVGNHYEPCIECFKVEDVPPSANLGRIISAAHIVLHQPEKGGELAFPLLGVSVTPEIGSVIVHREINSLGKTDERSTHGGCPVIIGEKWIATKLIYEVLD